jgi:hypothetical protein
MIIVIYLLFYVFGTNVSSVGWLSRGVTPPREIFSSEMVLNQQPSTGDEVYMGLKAIVLTPDL